jgi:DNA-binding transcriptional ArsR family regulator
LEIDQRILEYLAKQEWPVTTKMLRIGADVNWSTAQTHLLRLESEGKVKVRRIGRQYLWVAARKG